MTDSAILARASLPEPPGPASAWFRHDGAQGVVVGESGRVWQVDVDAEQRRIEWRPLAVTVPRERIGELRPCDLTGSHSLHRLLVVTDRPRVYDVASGALVAEVGALPGDGTAFALSPGGSWLVALDAETAWTVNLDASMPSWSQTGVFHQADAARPEGFGEGDDYDDDAWPTEALYLDHVDDLVTHPYSGGEAGADEPEMFWMAGGCYGEVVTHLAQVSFTGWTVGRVRGETRRFGEMVYDPVQVLRPFGQRHVFVVHGYGSGLAALDPATGQQHACRIRPPRQQPYAFIRGAVACGTAPIAFVSSADGDFIWRVGGRLTPVRPPGHVVALYPHAMLCLRDGEMLLCALPDWR